MNKNGACKAKVKNWKFSEPHFWRLRVLSFFGLFLFTFLSFAVEATAAANTADEKEKNSDWVHMPPGAKSAYMGINGGTMPISLLVANDGSALLSFVGKTGNDFLHTLAAAKLPLPSFSNSTVPDEPARNSELFAGNATISLPVIPTAGRGEEWLKSLPPFGFSVAPLAIEGQPDFPPVSPITRKYRNFYLPGSQLRNK